jgi:hypothetical protein
LQKEREEAAKLKSEQAEEVKPQPRVIPVEEVTPPKQETVEPETPEAQQYKMDIRVWATREQLAALKQFLIDNGIKYGKVSD